MPFATCVFCQVADVPCTKHGICATCNDRINQGAKARVANGSAICAYTYCDRKTRLVSQRGFCQECMDKANEYVRWGRARCVLCGHVEKLTKLGICGTCNHSFRVKTMELVNMKDVSTIAKAEFKTPAEKHGQVEKADGINEENEAQFKAKKVGIDPIVILQVEEDVAEMKVARVAETDVFRDKEKNSLAKRVEMVDSNLEAQKKKAAIKPDAASDSNIKEYSKTRSVSSFESISLEDAKSESVEEKDEDDEQEWNFVEISEIANQGTNRIPHVFSKKKWWF